MTSRTHARSHRRLAFLLAIIAPTFVAVTASTSHADRRSFLETYEYMTMPEGDVELEFWNRQSRAEFAKDSATAFELEIELEYGITSRWDIALYQVFRQSADPVTPEGNSPLGYNGTKIETRYRLGERGSNPVDIVLYLEAKKVFGADEVELEPKLILARDFGKVTVAVNAIAELEIENEREASGEYELEAKVKTGWAAGVTYEVSPRFKVGAETFGEVETSGDKAVEALVGPSISLAPSSKIWTAMTAAFGVTSDSPDFQFGFIVGVGL